MALALLALACGKSAPGPDAAKVFDAAPAARPPDAAPAIAAVDARPVDAALKAVDAASPDAAKVDAGHDARAADAAVTSADAAKVDGAARPAEAPPPDAAAAAAPAPPDAAPPDAAARPAAPPDAAPAPPPPPPAGKAEIVFEEPVSVGDVDVQPLIDAFEKARPTMESCRPRSGKEEKVRVHFFVGQTKIGMTGPSPDNPGDANVARCIANRVKSAGPKWPEDQDGILRVDVTVPPR